MSTPYNTLLEALLARQDLQGGQMEDMMHEIMSGNLSESQIAAVLIALRMKGETAEEITAAATIMREFATSIDVGIPNLVDTCGTGGDGTGTFNISTAAAIVAAAAGVKIAKHGNRSVSSNSGSADFLEAVGVNLELDAPQVAQCMQKIGIGFLFAPGFHQAMKHVVPTRKSIGVRTVFNLLGPLTNPAHATAQLIGVFDACWLKPMAQAARNLGVGKVMVVHGNDGMDEISISAPTQIVEVKDGDIDSYTIDPTDFGMARAEIESITVENTQQSIDIVKSVFNGETGAAHDIIVLNAAAVIYLSGLAEDLTQGIAQAREVIAQGAADKKLQDFIMTTQTLGQFNA